MKLLTKFWYGLLDHISPSRYPFELPPAKDRDYMPSLAELIQEPSGTIKGHTINFWFYREGRTIVEIIEAGHSNTSICSRVTSLIHETLIELEDIDIKLYTAGTLWLRVKDENSADQEFLNSLEMHLRDIEQKTGLVRVIRASISDLERFRQDLQKQFAVHGKTKKVFTNYKIETSFMNPGIFDYMPYPSFNSNKGISFTIKRSLFENHTFKKLAELHEISFRNYLIRDVIARAETYGEWLLHDIFELMKLNEKRKKMSAELWLSNIIPYSGVRDYYIGEASKGKGDMDPLFRKIDILYREWESQFYKDSVETPELTKSLLQAVNSWEGIVSPQIKSGLDYGTMSHARRFEDTVPYFILEDIHWLMKMIKILILESDDEQSAIRRIRELFQPMLSHYIIPDYISKQLSSAFRVNDIDDLWEKLHHIMDHLVKSNKDIPSRLAESLPTIFKELSEIKKDMKTRHKRMEFNQSVNEWILIDALLRGWPSFFLNTKELKDLYDCWVGEVRAEIWREIRFQLRTRNIIMLPFTEDNITYSIASNGKKFNITPYFGINSHFYTLVYHRKIGTVHYIFPWSYRDNIILNGNTNLQWPKSLMSECWDAINRQDLQAATFSFSVALKLHPVRACSEFFEKLWSYLGNIHDPNVASSALFQKGLKLFEQRESYEEGLRSLEEYISKYPDSFADPYIYLACGENFYTIMELQKNRENAIKEYSEYLHELDKASQKNQITKIVVGIALDKSLESRLSNIELFNDVELLTMKSHISKESAIEILNTAEDKIGMLNISSRSPVDGKIILELIASGFKSAMERELEKMRGNIENLDKNISLVSETLWTNLPQNIYYQKALELDNNYAKEVLIRKALFRSPKFQLEYEPYFDLNIADSKMRIAIYLWVWVTELKEIGIEKVESIASSFLERLKILDREPLGVSEDDRQRIERLIKTKIERLANQPHKEDYITQLDIISEAENIASSFMSDATGLYEKSHSMLPSFTPAYMKLTELRCILLPLYQESIQRICRSTPPLEMVIPGIKFNIEQDTQVYGRVEPHVIRLEENCRIVAYSYDNSILASIRFDYADELTINHLRESVKQPNFCRNLFPLSSSLANRILKTPILPSPRIKVFLDTLNNLKYPLTFVLAYMGARMSPNLSGTAFGVKVSKDLINVFRDDGLYTEEQQKKAEEYLKKLDNAKPIDRQEIVINKVFNKVLSKEGYKF